MLIDRNTLNIDELCIGKPRRVGSYGGNHEMDILSVKSGLYSNMYASSISIH